MESVGVITDEKQNYNYNINDSHNSADSAAVLSIFSTLLIGVSLLLALYLLWSIWNWYNLRNQKATSLRTISIRTGHVQLMDDTTATVIRSLDSIDKQKDWVAACGHTIVLQKRKTFSGWLIQLLLSSESSDKVAVVAHPTTAKLLQTRYTKATDNSNSSKNFNNSSTVIKDGEFSALSYHHPFLQEFLHFPLWKFVLRLLTKAFRLTTIIQSRESKVEAKIVDEEVQNTSALPSSDGSTTNADNFHDEVGVTVTDLSVAYGHLIWSDPRLFEKIVMVLVRVCHAIDTNSLRILPTKSSEASKNSRNNSASGIKDYNGRNILLEDYRSMRSSHGSISSVDSDTRDEKSKGKKSNSGSNYHKYYHNSEDGRNSYAYNSNGKLEEENSTGETTGLVEIDAICGQSVLDILLNILFGRNLWVDAESILTAIRELRDCSVKLNTMSLRDSWSAFVELRELENVKRKAWSMIDRVTRPEIEVLLAEVEGKFKTPLNRSDRFVVTLRFIA